MRLSTRLIIALTFILLVVILVGINATYQTFTHIFRQFELVFSQLAVFLTSFFVAFLCGLFLFTGVFCCWFLFVEIQIRRQKYLRFAPSEQGYYEAILTSQGFCKPSDNVPLHVPYTYSPHITMQAKKEIDQPQSDDAVVLELYDKGLSLRSIEKATGVSYRQVQKITQAKREG